PNILSRTLLGPPDHVPLAPGSLAPSPGLDPPPPPHRLRSLARSWLDEDAPWLDVAVATVGDRGVLAGAPFAEAVFGVLGCRVTWRVPEGAALPPGRVLVAEVEGPAVGVLGGERVALNILGRCSGVASMATRAVGVTRAQGWARGVGVVGGRGLELGGSGCRGTPEFGDSWIMECQAEIGGAASQFGEGDWRVLPANRVSPQELHVAAAWVKATHPGVTVEASGDIVLGTLPQFLGPHIDVVSMGCLTHSAPALDFALRVWEEGPDPV
uniref:Quinolinate phosphoribosyltransferase [decarboxylating] n=1 Tax=Catharus ustulatus TaxID=91951 RepID=A0A8C3U9U4_CATUS